jgi:steroid 5-alpha reductase family enzyme
MGDVLIICSQLVVAMYIFELTYRVKISPVSVVHHLGSILVAQAAITISIEGQKDSSVEFVLVTVWGKRRFLTFCSRNRS